MNILNNNYGFCTFVNVDIKQIDTSTNTIKKHIQKHNKATRNLVRGLLRFMEGRFTPTYPNPKPEYEEDAKNYIPCYISFGDGGVQYGDDGKPVLLPIVSQSEHVPDLVDWDTTVDYKSTSLVREFNQLSHERSKIRKQDDTFSSNQSPAGDMDTIVLYCEVAPNEMNTDIVDGQQKAYPRFITEVGLFSSPSKQANDLLAYVKLGNYPDPEYPDDPTKTKTNTLYVRPGDTVIITWYITIVAMSDVSVVDSSEELLQPELGTLTIETEDT